MFVDVCAADHDHQTDDEKQHDGADLEHASPEFEFTKRFRGKQIDDEYHREGDEHRNRCRRTGKIGLDIDRDCGQFGNSGQGPVEPVHPSGDESGPLTEELAHVRDERARGLTVQDEFAESAHQEVRDDADCRITDQQGRPGAVQPGCRSEEQTCADRTPDRDHLHRTAPQRLLVSDLFRVERGTSLFRRGHRFSCPPVPASRAAIPSAPAVTVDTGTGVRWKGPFLTDVSFR